MTVHQSFGSVAESGPTSLEVVYQGQVANIDIQSMAIWTQVIDAVRVAFGIDENLPLQLVEVTS